MRTSTKKRVVAMTPNLLPYLSMQNPKSDIPMTSPMRMELESRVLMLKVKALGYLMKPYQLIRGLV